ncbi:hypothetical protein As57867_005287, partial [Aphanomyces stellatus]
MATHGTAAFIQRSYTVRFLRTLYMLLTGCVSGVFASAFLVINIFYSIALIVLRPVFGAPWLGVDHELFYRTHAEALDKLAGNDTTTTTKLTKREIDALLQKIVQAQNDAVQEQIERGEKIIETKDTMSLSSVVVATVFFGAYCLYYWPDKGHSNGDVNSKFLGGLPIVLSMLLLKKEDLESVAATCRTYIFLKRMGRTQSYLLCDKQQQEQDTLLPSPYDKDAYYMARHLRYQTLMKMTADDAISFALYVVALSTYNFERTNDEPNALPNMQPTSDRLTLSPLVKKNNPSFWARRIGDHHNATDAFPAFLLRLPKLDGTYVDSTEDHMTLFSMPVMDTYTTHHVTETITL